MHSAYEQSLYVIPPKACFFRSIPPIGILCFQVGLFVLNWPIMYALTLLQLPPSFPIYTYKYTTPQKHFNTLSTNSQDSKCTASSRGSCADVAKSYITANNNPGQIHTNLLFFYVITPKSNNRGREACQAL
jgi:hypothetical protein